MKNHFEIQTIRRHTSPVKSIGVIRNNFNLDFITSCHDQINLWRLDEGITLLRFELVKSRFMTRIPTVKLKIPGKAFLNPELLLHSSYGF